MSDLREFHLADETATSATAKIIGAVLIVLAVGAIGAYTFETGMWKAPPKPVVAAHNLPAPTPPAGQNMPDQPVQFQ